MRFRILVLLICNSFYSSAAFAAQSPKLAVSNSSNHWLRIDKPASSTIPPPQQPPNEQLQLYLDVSILDIDRIDGVRMEMSLQLELQQYWQDFSYNVSDAGSPDTLWIPDTVIISNQRSNSRMMNQFTLRYNLETREFEKSERFHAVIKCEPMDFSLYPFDDQTCTCTFQTASDDNQQPTLKWSIDHQRREVHVFGTTTHQPGLNSRKLDVLSPFQVFQVVQISIQQPDAGSAAQLHLQIKIRRLWTAYLYSHYTPLTTLIATSLLSLWLVHPKISFVVNFLNILSLNILQAVRELNSDTPRLSYCTALDAYSIICLVFILLILLLNVYILYYIQSEEGDSADGGGNNDGSVQNSPEQKYFLPKQDENRSFRLRQQFPHPFLKTIHSRRSPPSSSSTSDFHKQQVEMSQSVPVVLDSPSLEVVARNEKSAWTCVRETVLDKLRRSGHTIFLFTFLAVFFFYWVILLSLYYT